ncbi:hypothetical protein SAMN02745136_03308 [Anaerocolumna jejuensis DSM 15929]|uniref:Uncharacterized protein n=1 Tax=Anaerocolumna jejuensis DSM 15929 TaxID=1121322 RepID=A0A1M6V7H4_9FIRM|nr:hypothetical protein [Anaerocolumna jejuensis]SHK77321.1 hypothetical protein SAMN02745136_03308 [Anaerocolumna jejuensis DSM 15929]
MNITKRLYTYPVLSEEKDDYKSSVYDVDFQYRMNGVNNLLLEFNITLNNEEIRKLLLDGKAEYVIHIECTNTAFRTTLHSITEQSNIDIPVGRIFGKLEVIALIVLKENINHFENSDWNEDYNGISFDLAKGSILGYKNLPALDIVKNYEELTSASSIFKIYKRLTTEEKPMDVNIDSSLIKIGLGTQEYETYSRFCKKAQFQPILNSMLVFPALVYVFEELKQEIGIEANQGKAWYISLDKAYEKRGINFIDEIKDDTKTSVQLAQEAMELPLSKALSMFTELFENMEEEEDI